MDKFSPSFPVPQGVQNGQVEPSKVSEPAAVAARQQVLVVTGGGSVCRALLAHLAGLEGQVLVATGPSDVTYSFMRQERERAAQERGTAGWARRPFRRR